MRSEAYARDIFPTVFNPGNAHHRRPCHHLHRRVAWDGRNQSLQAMEQEMTHPAVAKKAVIEPVRTDANGLQIMDSTVKLTLLDKDDNVMAIWWGAEELLAWIEAVHNGDSTKETIVHIGGFGLNRDG